MSLYSGRIASGVLALGVITGLACGKVDSGATGVAAGASSAPARAGACPVTREPAISGQLDAVEIDEASGIVSSSLNPDVFWVHNDSGDSARAFAVSATGNLLATLRFDGAAPVDIEDIAIEDVGPGESFLYLGDIGDNGSVRSELTIHRVAEPKLAPPSAKAEEVTRASEKMTVRYHDGPHDAEALLFDPVTKELLLATKKLFGGSVIYRVGPFHPGATVTTERVGLAAADFVTGGDISRDGRLIALRNYGTSAFVWTRAPGESLQTAIGRAPCRVPVVTETQGEAFGFLAGGMGYVTISEGASAELHVAVFE
jgi:hypothetical protein